MVPSLSMIPTLVKISPPECMLMVPELASVPPAKSMVPKISMVPELLMVPSKLVTVIPNGMILSSIESGTTPPHVTGSFQFPF